MSSLPEIRTLWDDSDVEGARARMMSVLEDPRCQGAYRDELLTCVARTFGHTRDYEQGHAILDGLEARAHALDERVGVLLLIERGRMLHRASYGCEPAVSRLERARDLAKTHGFDALWIEVTHLLVDTVDEDEAMDMYREAVAFAERSRDPDVRPWLGVLLHDLGWALHEEGRDEEALAMFARALEARIRYGASREDVLTGRWSVAMMWRVLGDPTRALTEQLAIERLHADTPDVYNKVEIARCLSALERVQEARTYAEQAIALLESQPWTDEDTLEELEGLIV